jgi:hypothetical protein
MKLLIMKSSPASYHFLPLRSEYSQRLVLKHPQYISGTELSRFIITLQCDSKDNDSVSVHFVLKAVSVSLFVTSKKIIQITRLILFVNTLEGNESFIVLNFQTSISTDLWS